MRIYIPTVARQDRQETAYLLKQNKIPYTIVTAAGQTGYHDEDVVWTPPHVKGIMATRNWILDTHPRFYKGDLKLVLLDDDLMFYERSVDGSKFPKTTNISRLLLVIEQMLENFAHGGVTEKFMSQTKPRNYIRNARYYHVLAYNLAKFPDPQPRARVLVGEDHDINLQLLTRGCPNFVLTEWANADRPYAKGGCSTWRNPALELQEADKLAALFPTIVRVVKFPDKPCRLRIQWTEAARIGGLS